MAKQRRARTRPAKSQPPKPAPAASAPVPTRAAAAPPRPGYSQAVALYERGLAAIQRHDYRMAAGLLESVLKQYPEERELHERVRLYLNVCARQAAPREAAPTTIEERLYASTLAINAGAYDTALHHLRMVRDEDPDNDHALYMLAVAHALRGEPVEAVSHLQRAIAINPANRGTAKLDPDLESLRHDEAFRAALEAPSLPRPERRRPARGRSAR